ncbi:uncharacterized protein LOC111685082 [Lucilia cuprina]|uniref:uncharacterized protein LOC111685082 n=1 Tax=Lucilia cuprina TaxID=7375 RepID=UPI001F0543BF|nr:uncharacterized protein LOC111685082 [Lucilia cuprina]
MFTTPRKQKQHSMDAKEYHNSPQHKSLININTNTPIPTTSSTTTTTNITNPIVFENGTMFGAISPDTTNNSAKLSVTSSDNTTTYLTIPEIVISASSSSNTLNRSRCEMSQANSEESAMESTALLEATTTTTSSIIPSAGISDSNDEPAVLQDEFDQFILNRTTSESNILESSIYSELQFPPSLHGGSILAINSSNGVGTGGYVSSSGGPNVATQLAGPQTPPHGNARQTKRTKRKHKTKSKCTATAATLAAAASQRSSPTHYPPRYTAIFMDAHHHGHQQYGNVMTTSSQHHSGGGAANALGQIASAAASSPFLNAPVAQDTAAYMQQFQYFQQRPMVTTMSPMAGHHRHHRSLYDGATTTAGIENPLNLHHTTATTAAVVPPAGGGITPPIRLSFRKWFSRPSLPFVIGILALGGVACTLGGIVLGSTGLIEHSTQYLSAALLMIGIGVSLLVISGAIWRLSLPDDVDECPCYRHMEMCRNCNSPYCNSRLMGGNYLYPEFQHRPPPPSYLTSLNECAGMSLLFHPTASAPQAAAYSTLRVNTPPPLYRSTNSLSVYATSPPPSHPSHSLTLTSAGQQYTAANTSTIVPNLPPNSVGIVPDHSVITMSTVMENLQAQTQPLIKEFNYLELD